MKKLTLLVVLVALLAACEENKSTQAGRGYLEDEEKAKDPMDGVAMPSDTLFYSIHGFNKASTVCESDTANCASFNSSFPLIEMRIHGRIADSINNFIRTKLYRPLIGDKPANGINDLLEPYFAAYKQELDDARKDGETYILAWNYNRQFTVLENSKRMFSVEHFERSYAGGAHPNHYTNYYHFNPQTGSQIRLADIFKAGYETALNKLGEKKFRKQEKIAAGVNLEDAGYWFKDNKFYLPQNFLLKEKGIMFLYNPYEVASYAEGQIELFFTYQELNSLLRDEFNPLSEENMTSAKK